MTEVVRISHFHYLPINRKQRRSWGSELPTEVLTRILNYIPSKRTLQRLALSCRRFHHLVGYLLFQDIHVDCTLHKSTASGPQPAGKDGIRDLVLHLLRHHSFAFLVHNVRLCGPQSEDYLVDVPGADDVDIELATAVKLYLRNPENASTKLARIGVGWLTFASGDRITPLVLLLALLPRIATVHIQMPDEKLLADSLLSLNVFSELQAITLEWIPSSQRPLVTTLDGSHLKELISVKSLNKVSAVRLASQPLYTTQSNSFHNLTSKTSSVTCLELRESRLSAADTVPLFGAFESLKTFVYEHSWNNSMLGRKIIRPSSLVSALSTTQSESLESLWIDFSQDSQLKQSTFNRGFFPETTLQALSAFQNLRHICLPMEFMFGYPPRGMWDAAPYCFPTTIETIVLVNHANIRECPVSAFMDDFSQFLSDGGKESDDNLFRSVLPRLRTLIVVANFDRLRSCSSMVLSRMEKVPDLDIVFAHNPSKERDRLSTSYECKVSTERVREVEDLMGLTRFGIQRWKGVNKKVLSFSY